jgi:hypothetical protein
MHPLAYIAELEAEATRLEAFAKLHASRLDPHVRGRIKVTAFAIRAEAARIRVNIERSRQAFDRHTQDD